MPTRRVSVQTWPVTVAEAKLRLRIDGTADDADLAIMIEAATELAESVTRRAIAAGTYELTLDAFPDEIRLLHPPVTAVTQVRYIAPDALTVVIPSADYALDANSEPCWLLPALGNTWPETLDTANAVAVRYAAGWGTDAPASVKQFILLHVGAMYRDREAASEKPLTMLPWCARLLDPWKLWEV